MVKHDFIGLMAAGAVFGVLPDIDILFSGFGKGVHRSPATHSLLASAIMSLAFLSLITVVDGNLDPNPFSELSLAPMVAVAFLASFLHSGEDSLTSYGCRLFYPFSRRVFRGPVRYDDWAANGILSLIAIAAMLASQAIASASF